MMEPILKRMTRWQTIKDAFERVRREDPGRRAALLAEICASDEELRAEVESPLRSLDEASDFLEQPAVEYLGWTATRSSGASVPSGRPWRCSII